MADSIAGLYELFNEYKTDYLFHFSRVLNKILVAPEMIQIMLTHRCNIKCKICNVWKQPPGEEMATETVKSIIDQSIEMGIKTVYLTGGEVLLRKDIFELIDYSARPGINVTVNTNGSFITDKFAKRIVASKLTCLNFSLDGALPQTHNAIRGEQVFERAIKAIEHINYYKKIFRRDDLMKEDSLHLVLTSVLTKSNLKELTQLIELGKELQCNHISFQPLVDNGNLLETPSFRNEFWIGEEDIPELQKAFDELEKTKNRLSLNISVDFMPEKTIQHFKRQRVVNSCFAGYTRIFVNPRGEMSFVCFPSFGDIKNKTLKQAWFSEEAFAIRKKLKSCTVNCTQFCSERSASDSILEIHKRFRQRIQSLQAPDQECLVMQENSFLKLMSSLVSSANIPENERKQTLCDIEQALCTNVY